MLHDRLQRARLSLLGLSLGDALGSQFFIPGNRHHLSSRSLLPAPWQWTDDTEMTCSVYLTLASHRAIDQDVLAASFARRHDFDRGYGPAAGRPAAPPGPRRGDWRSLAAGLFGGSGSWGNGAAMRVAPLGAFFAGDPAEAARQAALSATVTHTHPEAVAGAIAVAVAAAHAASGPPPGPFIDRVLEHVPPGKVHDGIAEARRMLTVTDPETAAYVLGNGRQVAAHDTVPFTIWAAARHLTAYEQGIWATAAAGGDIDTTCAIVGGITAAGLDPGRLPGTWLRAAEALPELVDPS